MASFIQTMDMAVKQAVFNRFAPILGVTDINQDCAFWPKSVAQRAIAEKRGEGSVEFINVWRPTIVYDWQRQQSIIARQGIMMNYNNSSDMSAIVTVKGVPVAMEYEFWLWSKDLDKLMECTESYMTWQHDTPNIILNYVGLYEMDMYLKFDRVIDDSPIGEMYDKGLYYVMKFNLKMDGWILTLISQKTILKIILDLYLREGQKPNYIDTLLAEYIITASSTTTTIYS